jgi:aryl-alcohol dehydrogenase-like predicted oxidoreductase
LDRHEWLRGVLTDESIEKVRQLGKLASEIGVTLPVLAIAWLLRLPQVTSVITGATSLKQFEENVSGIEAVDKLTPEVLEQVETILDNKPVPED